MSENSTYGETRRPTARGKAQLQFHPIAENISLCMTKMRPTRGRVSKAKGNGLVRRRPLVTQIRLLRVTATYQLSKPRASWSPSVNWG